MEKKGPADLSSSTYFAIIVSGSPGSSGPSLGLSSEEEAGKTVVDPENLQALSRMLTQGCCPKEY
jgi:hypothetical protein